MFTHFAGEVCVSQICADTHSTRESSRNKLQRACSFALKCKAHQGCI